MSGLRISHRRARIERLTHAVRPALVAGTLSLTRIGVIVPLLTSGEVPTMREFTSHRDG
jgi:hypothetical protein